jgi:hypothetical protein
MKSARELGDEEGWREIMGWVRHHDASPPVNETPRNRLFYSPDTGKEPEPYHTDEEWKEILAGVRQQMESKLTQDTEPADSDSDESEAFGEDEAIPGTPPQVNYDHWYSSLGVPVFGPREGTTEEKDKRI